MAYDRAFCRPSLYTGGYLSTVCWTYLTYRIGAVPIDVFFFVLFLPFLKYTLEIDFSRRGGNEKLEYAHIPPPSCNLLVREVLIGPQE